MSNLVSIHAAVTGRTPAEAAEEAQREGVDTGQYKGRVAEALNEHLRPIRERLEHYEENRDYLERVLDGGAERAAAIAERTMEEVRVSMGFR